MRRGKRIAVLLLALLLALCLAGCEALEQAAAELWQGALPAASFAAEPSAAPSPGPSATAEPSPAPVLLPSAATAREAPPFDGSSPYAVLAENRPSFAGKDEPGAPFERYSPLDSLGRCGAATARIDRSLMPKEPRGEIGMVRPSGWQLTRYDFLEDRYLYNRCHLIGYQLTGENANEKNLITGTRYLNVQGMLPFENAVAACVRGGGTVLYRATPCFRGDDLVAYGVELEALSLGDGGEAVCFHVLCYNAQPGVEIDYATGKSRADGSITAPAASPSPETPPTPGGSASPAPEEAQADYILNTSSMKFHLPSCPSAAEIAPHNRKAYAGSREILIEEGYSPCKVCKP